jgi:pimeloyl-ACP methyl ester carboxylesterase
MAPGLGHVWQQYRFLGPQLASAGYRAVTVDLRGHGDSSTDWPAYISTATGRDLAALVAHLEAGPAVLVGTSFAGAAVVHAAAGPDFPDPAAEAAWIAGRAQGEVHLVEGAGHHPHAEVPDATAPAIRSFLDRVTRGA